MKRLYLALAVCAGLAAVAPAAASAEPPQFPPGCNVVLATPAATTGSGHGLTQKMQAYQRVCLP